ncbi:MAG: glycosyltransferase [Prevotella sp.]|nr:glycosyltransferase [Prevotella sp.]
MTEHLHIICLAQPYPPTYGGAIDMFYKIKALHGAGIKLILHVFLYRDYKEEPELEKLASKVFYYRRDTGAKNVFSSIPYIVKSRINENLLNNLCRDKYPILFEGLHTCGILSHPQLRDRFKMVRMHNIEHDYYKLLSSYHPLAWASLFYRLEARKLKKFERILNYANRILAISNADVAQLCRRFPDKDVRLLNCFFDDTINDCDIKTKPYLLYHGNLSISENIKVAEYLLDEIAPNINHRLIIAGRNPTRSICQKAAQYDNVEVIANPVQPRMEQLMTEAQVNLAITFQPTGIKLKLLNGLYKGHGYCIANREMLHGNSLGTLCIEANSKAEILSAIDKAMKSTASSDVIAARRKTIADLGYNSITNIIDEP